MASINLDTAASLNITCRRGDTFVMAVDFGEAVNTSGWEFKVKSKQQVTSDKRLKSKEENAEIIVEDDNIAIGDGTATGTTIANSKATITIAADIMNEILPGTYSYDFQNNTDGVVKTYIFGSFRVKSDV
jgi:hypothetical protein